MSDKKRDELINLINSRIETLRPKLLDLGRRNPLIATKFSDRSHSHVRVVDELPQVLFDKLINEKMCFAPLPSLEKEPRDENTAEFQRVLADARITDKIYIETLDNINQDSDYSAEKLANAEKELKTRLRIALKMPPRQTKQNLSLVQHAKIHNIPPSYDLFLPEEKNEDGRHEDEFIQTLLMPDFLTRKLNSLLSKHKTWTQETGINVLRAAFGFLEWCDVAGSKSSLAPLVLLPVEIDKKTTQEGFEYWVSSQGDSPEVNTVLAEKLRIDFGIDLPVFNSEEMDIEAYFVQVSKICKKELSWKVRRQIAIGVFPSARMAMYHDLNTKTWDFASHNIINDLLGAGDGKNNTDMPFAEEYKIDDPKIEVKVPLLVMDADSSQHSAIVDIIDNKNIAVEGPPGTGKSQTIVNTITAALSQGKKVLFVAEKMAALEVVRNRLEACNLGEFLLTLQANRASKELVVQSLRKRLSVRKEKDSGELDEKVRQFKSARTQINKYIEVTSSVFANTSFTVYEILGWGIQSHEALKKLGLIENGLELPRLRDLKKEQLEAIFHLCDQVESCWNNASGYSKTWAIVEKKNIDPYTSDEILLAAKNCFAAHEKCEQQCTHLKEIGLSEDIAKEASCELKDLFKHSLEAYKTLDVPFIERVVKNNAFDKLSKFFNESTKLQLSKDEFHKFLSDPLMPTLSKKLTVLSDALSVIEMMSPFVSDAEEKINLLKSEITSKKTTQKTLKVISQIFNLIKDLPVSLIVLFVDIASSFSKDVLFLRREVFLEPETKEKVIKASKTAQRLLEQAAKLGGIFYSLKNIEQDRVKESSETLLSSGFFSIFMPKYHKAKKFYKSIASKKTFNKRGALQNLRELGEWLAESQEFCNNIGMKRILGTHFDGIQTNFTPFLQLLIFYDKIDSDLRGIENAYLRKVLHEAPISAFINIPEIDEKHPIRRLKEKNYEELTEIIASLENKLASYEDSKKTIVESLGYLNSDNVLPAGEYSSFVLSLNRFQDEWTKLKTDDSIRLLLGDCFNGPTSLPDSLKPSFELLGSMQLIPQDSKNSLLSALNNDQLKRGLEILDSVVSHDNHAALSLHKVSDSINVDPQQYFGAYKNRELKEYFLEASKDRKGLIAFSQLYSIKSDLSDAGYGHVADYLLTLPRGLKDLCEIVRLLIGQSLAKEVYATFGGILASYNGVKLNSLRKRIAELDKQILLLSRKRLRLKLLSEASPPSGSRSGRRSEWTEMVLLNNETTKKRRFLPARELTKRAGRALLELKPCWMMSPLAVAQYINKGEIDFDLLIVDEASQMTPEDSLGAIIRSKQVMIAGDTNQLPPTSFFKKFVDTIDEDDDLIAEESILEMANAVFRPRRRLRWHYRSRDPSLIAFSNRYVYDNNLLIFPSPNIDNKTKGVSIRKVDGLYSNGTNPIEASEIANAVIDFMHKHRKMSLGVVLLNQRQRELVQEELEFLIARDPIAQEYVEYWEAENDGLEYLFIKNLENVQGDERDVIYIGTVYGPEQKNAPVMQRFGPINGISGKRRLNVLFTRAKHKIVTFSSMASSDVKVTDQSNPGVALLKYWLEYCASGQLLSYELTQRKPGSIFEEYVITQLTSIGCQPVPQVGVAGFYIDIGVRHSKWPHGFIMGVECDGAAYHSSKSARDRDRLRQEVLEGLGWNLYRIWSVDWFLDPVKEAQKLREAIESRLKELLDIESHKKIEEQKMLQKEKEILQSPELHDGTLRDMEDLFRQPVKDNVQKKSTAQSGMPSYGACSKCDKKLYISDGPFGVYLKCSHCKNTQRVPAEVMKDIIEKDVKCPKHKVALRLTSGRRGFFMGCPLYPRCSYTCVPKVNPKFLPNRR
ncbi:MAG: DUF4011 domain-containing protein [Candidatus Gygaella obscura]|nr:DUF4011 domain-containing protein [Candidatus Gygaella obscura]